MGPLPTGDPLILKDLAKGVKEAKGAKRAPARVGRRLGALGSLGALGDARRDGGQLMMLAGIVLTISFILTALTLAQVSALEKEAAQEASTPIVAEWRFLHDRLTSNVRTAITPDTTNQSLNDTVLPALGATFRALAAEKGYDFVLRKAGDGNFHDNGNESGLLVAGAYKTWSHDGTVNFEPVPADPFPYDGIIWQTPCPDATGPAAGCIGGLYLFLRLADATTTMEESVLFGVNQ